MFEHGLNVVEVLIERPRLSALEPQRVDLPAQDRRWHRPVDDPRDLRPCGGGLEFPRVRAHDAGKRPRAEIARGIGLEHDDLRRNGLAGDTHDHLGPGIDHLRGLADPPGFDDRSAPLRHTREVAQVRVDPLDRGADQCGGFPVGHREVLLKNLRTAPINTLLRMKAPLEIHLLTPERWPDLRDASRRGNWWRLSGYSRAL